MYVCVCNSVTDAQIRKACSKGAKSIESLQQQLNVATCCGRCKDCAKKLIHESFSAQLLTQQPSVAC